MVNFLFLQKVSVGFKIQEGTFKAGFSATGNRDGEISAVKVIVPQGSTWVIENSNQFSDITEIIVENGGKIEIAKKWESDINAGFLYNCDAGRKYCW